MLDEPLLFHLLSSSCQIFYCIYRPTRNFAYVCSYCRYVTQKEDGCEEQGEPDYVAIDLLYRHKHHGVQVVAAHQLTEVEMREVELGECQLATVVHHVLAEEMGEDGGVKTITHSTAEIHVNNVEHEQSHEKLFETWYRLVQCPHQRWRKDAVAKTTKHNCQSVLLNVYPHTQRCVHEQSVCKDG